MRLMGLTAAPTSLNLTAPPGRPASSSPTEDHPDPLTIKDRQQKPQLPGDRGLEGRPSTGQVSPGPPMCVEVWPLPSLKHEYEHRRIALGPVLLGLGFHCQVVSIVVPAWTLSCSPTLQCRVRWATSQVSTSTSFSKR